MSRQRMKISEADKIHFSVNNPCSNPLESVNGKGKKLIHISACI